MTLDQDVAHLRNLPIFAEFSDEQLRLTAFSAEPLNLPEGTVLFREGAAADGGYVVVEGSVRLEAEGPEGAIEKGTAGPGALIGQMALLCATTRPVTATTAEPTRLLAISRRLLKRVLQEYPDMADTLSRALSERLSAMTQELARARLQLLEDDEEEQVSS